ncbi:hypothetical protein P9139_06825 [Curtobacterium flaccumfaciens]|nr:hypothetical protein P9139_06825 [Curtobacterium flaccumfaciens]
MPSFLEGLPFRWLVLALFAVVFCRAQATYWLARGAAAGAVRSRRAGGSTRLPSVGARHCSTAGGCRS